MNNEKFDQEVLKKIREALGDFHPRYLNKVYGDITLEEQLKKTDELEELKAKVYQLENNHIGHLKTDTQNIGQEVYKLALELADLKKLLKGK
jgi:hypothetical protein